MHMAVGPRIGLMILLLCLSSMSWAAEHIKLAVVTWVGYGPLYVAKATGGFKKYGLDVELVNFTDNAAMVPALYSGSVDVAALTYDQVIGAVGKDLSIKVIMPIDYSAGGDAIVATRNIRSLTDLKGQKIAYAPLSPSDFLLGYALAQAGIDAHEITPVHTSPEGVPAILASGAAPVGVTYEPNVSAILNRGGGKFHVLLSTREAKGIITDVLAVKSDTIIQRPQSIEGLIRAYLDGLAYMQREPDKACAIIARSLGISIQEAKTQLASVYNPQLGEMMDVFTPSRQTSSFFVSGELIGDILLKQQQIPRKPRIENTFDARFIQALQHERQAVHAPQLPALHERS